MALEIIPRKEKEKPPFARMVAYYSGMSLLIILVVSSLVFVFFQWRFSQETEVISALISERKTEEIIELEQKIENYEKKTRNFAQLIKERESSISFLKVVEKIIHPDVFLTELEIDVAEGRISAEGIAGDIRAFDQQSDILKKQVGQTIFNFDMSNFKWQEDKRVSFSLDIFLDAKATDHLENNN